MDIITAARELGKAIQQDETYINLNVLQQKNDADEQLQKLIGDFNLRRIDLNNEINKKEKDQETIERLNQEVRKAYGEIMVNDNMLAYNEAKTKLDKTMDFVLQIIRGSVSGLDPETIEYQSGCSGSCSSCSGCE